MKSPAKNFRTLPHAIWFISGFLFCLHNRLTAQQTPTVILNEIVASGLSSPVQIANAADGTGRLFIVQKAGTIKVFDRTDDDNFTDQGTFFEISGIATSGEQGLLSVAFHPNYSENRKFYVFYTKTNNDLEIAGYEASEADPNRFEPTSGQILLTIPHPTYTNHNGGEMHFGPDGFLYASTGDGGGGGDPDNNAQNPAANLGKMLRLDVDGDDLIPESNPVAGSPVYASGLRNPFRWSFDSQTNDAWIADVGQGAFEEINFIPFDQLESANFGWPCYEGNQSYNSSGCGDPDQYVFPAYVYPIGATHGRSVIGGVVYRGSAFPALQGRYIGTDYFSDKLHIITRNGDAFDFNDESQGATGIADFGESENGELYAVSLTQNRLYRVMADPSLPVAFVSFSVTESESKHALLSWSASESGPFDRYEVQRSPDASDFSTIATVNSQESDEQIKAYTYEDATAVAGQSYYYRIKAIDSDGSHLFSSIASFFPMVLSTGEQRGIRHILPTIVADGRMEVNNDAFEELRIVNLSGQTIQKFDLPQVAGKVILDGVNAGPGLYMAILKSDHKAVVEKIIIP